jgi:DNA topoisomerase-2
MANKYKKHDQISHLRSRPDTYIGSINNTEETRMILVAESVGSVGHKEGHEGLIAARKTFKYNPGLEQCIHELIVNAIDHAQKYKEGPDAVTKIEVTVTDDTFSISNNGKGIPIELHPEYKVYVPELIFGNMLTSSNYDDSESRTWGGTNGIGAKAANIFSTEFSLDICCQGLRYLQTFSKGMTCKTEPVITKVKSKDYTKITCKPDFAAFKLKNFVKDSEGNNVDNKLIIFNRVYEASAVTPKKVNVYLNDSKISVKDFKDYCDLFLKTANQPAESSDHEEKPEGPEGSLESPEPVGNIKKIIYEKNDGSWSVVVAKNPFDQPTQISFVNGIRTEKNGTHVKHVFEDQIIKKVVDIISSKASKDNITIRPSYIRDNLIIFVKCYIVNPRFNSQTKTELNNPISSFSSKCEIPDAIINKIAKLDIVDKVLSIAKFNELENMKKTISASGSKKSRITGIPKLDDANWAGTKKSNLCTLILTEGDSAKSTALAGLAIVGKDAWGVFPLKGKLLNVRTASVNDLKKNEEIAQINKILGLSFGLDDRSRLRYNNIMIMTDSDHDGSHIKGLLINYFTYFCPKIITNGFITSLLTPVVKVTLNGPAGLTAASASAASAGPAGSKKGSKGSKGSEKVPKKNSLNFYDYNSFEKWKNTEGQSLKGYTQKYYKGLGTSTTEEAKDYFRSISNNQIEYTWDPNTDSDSILLAFDAKRADDRKEWIFNSIKLLNEKGSLVDYSVKKVPVSSFINNELVSFSIYDCERALPNMIDGLKVSQRKVLYGSMEKNINSKKSEIKVAQLGAFISEKTHYHHGEVSLEGTIVGMAQDFVGSGNLQLLFPNGQFGSRNLGGKDSASSRYIFTYLQPYVKTLFNDTDFKILDFNYEDGNRIEPKFYVPIIPMALVNGVDGIGTGWSTNIPCFNPIDIIDRIRKLLKDSDYQIEELVPYYKGFRGSIVKDSCNKWISSGIFERPKTGGLKHVIVRELPVGLWYDKFKTLLCELSEKKEPKEQKDSKESKKKKTSKKKDEDPIVSSYSSKIITVNDIDYEEFDITFYKDLDDQSVVKILKLQSSLSATNLVGFDAEGSIKKYENVEEILWNHYKYRLEFYQQRKDLIIRELKDRIELLSEKARFIKCIHSGSLVVFKIKQSVIVENLIKLKFKPRRSSEKPVGNKGSEEKESEETTESDRSEGSFNYLLNMQINSFSEEKIKELELEIEKLNRELEIISAKTKKDLWLEDLETLEKMIM